MLNGAAIETGLRGSLDGKVVLNQDFFHQADVQLLEEQTDSYTPVVWFEKGVQRTQGLFWRNADDQMPYPILAVKTVASVDEEIASRVAAA